MTHGAETTSYGIGKVVVYEEGPARSRVVVLDPIVQLGITGRKDIEPLAIEARQRLERALGALPTA